MGLQSLLRIYRLSQLPGVMKFMKSRHEVTFSGLRVSRGVVKKRYQALL
jgi:hypothetical protein